MMEDSLKLETESLKRSWACHRASMLRDYLVQDVEDPRINVQSLLSRHFLIRELFGNAWDALIEHELRFALVLNRVPGLLKKCVRPGQLGRLLDALLEEQDQTEKLVIPGYVSETFSKLNLPNYICNLLTWAPAECTEPRIPEHVPGTLQVRF